MIPDERPHMGRRFGKHRHPHNHPHSGHGHPAHCHMKGFLSFLILWMIKKQSMNGADIATEMEKRKGRRPSPGTLYPVLKHLRDAGLVEMDENKVYTITAEGERELETSIESFFNTFWDIDEMRAHCGCKGHK